MMALNPDPQARYKGMIQAFHSIVTKEKPRVLFRGIGVVASGAGPAHAIYFACYEFSKNLLSGGSRSTVLSQGELVKGSVIIGGWAGHFLVWNSS